MARATQLKSIRLYNQTTGAALTGETVELRRGATSYPMTEIGSTGIYKNDAVLPGQYSVYVGAIDTDQTVPVGAGELDRPDYDANPDSFMVTDSGGVPTWSSTAALSGTLASAKIYVGNGSNEAAAVTPSGDLTLNNAGVFSLVAGAVGDSKLRDSVGLSVVGRAGSTTGDVADITASTDGDVLRRSGTALGFGTIPIASVTSLQAALDSKSFNLFSNYTSVTQSGVVTEQSLAGTGLGSTTIDADQLNVQGAAFEIYLCGVYTTDGSSGNATIRVMLGSTVFRTTGSFSLDNNITDGIWWIRGAITTKTTGATGTMGGQLMWEHQSSNVGGSQVLHVQGTTTTGDVTLDLTGDQAFDVDWTADDAGTSITCTCFKLNKLR